ncbi:Protein of unknown function [Gryllus bimaculatus]|nr:Protein of unknown function [Gryllus bimaculatus]
MPYMLRSIASFSRSLKSLKVRHALSWLHAPAPLAPASPLVVALMNRPDERAWWRARLRSKSERKSLAQLSGLLLLALALVVVAVLREERQERRRRVALPPAEFAGDVAPDAAGLWWQSIGGAAFAVAVEQGAVLFMPIPEFGPVMHFGPQGDMPWYVCWTAYLLRAHGKSGALEPVPLPGAPFSHYYAQDVSDEGIIMETDVTVKELT